MVIRDLSPEMLVHKSATAVVAEVDGQMVALDINKGVCYGLNKVATRIWQLIETPTSVQTVCDTLLKEFDVETNRCVDETTHLIGELIAANLAVKN